MSPGSTVRFEASITSVPAGQPPPGEAVVTASIRPLSIWITASRTGGAPVPSIRVPARTIFIALLGDATFDRLLGLPALGVLLLDHLIREIVLVDVGDVRHRLPADLLRRDQLDVVEPDVGVEAALGRGPAQPPDAPGPGVVGGEGEEPLVERNHRLFVVVLGPHGAKELDPGVDVGLASVISPTFMSLPVAGMTCITPIAPTGLLA